MKETLTANEVQSALLGWAIVLVEWELLACANLGSDLVMHFKM